MRIWCIKIGIVLVLHFNIIKTKIIVFNKRGRLVTENNSIYYVYTDTEYVKQQIYLGIILSISGSLKEAQSDLYKKALKNTFQIFKNIKHTDLSIKTSLYLFDLWFQIWGILLTTMQNKDKDLYDIVKNWIIETLHIIFSKVIRSGKKSTNIAILSDLF
jgi:hypothetical protein